MRSFQEARHMNSKNAERTESAVRTARARVGWTQAELAQRAGVAVATVSLIERAPGLLSPRIAAQLAAVLQMEPRALLGEAARLRARRFMEIV
jgi:transcriptional regulator with XRE-family HTH domain